MSTIPEAFKIALEHHQAGRLGAAERIYRLILTTQPNHADSLHLLGVIALQAGRPEAAVKCISQAIQLQGTVAAYHNNLGNAFKTLGQDQAATDCHRRALEIEPNYPDAHVNLGIDLQECGQTEAAARHFRQAVELHPNFAEAHCHLGRCFQDQEKPDDAVACYRRALELKPDYYEAVQGLGEIFKEQGRMDQAAECYRQVVKLRPEDLEGHFNLARACQMLEQYDAAVAGYQRALELRPDYVEAAHNLGHAFKMQGKMDEAADCYRRTVELRPNYLSALGCLTHVLQQACDWAEVPGLAQRVVTLVDEAAPEVVQIPASPFFFLALPTVTTAAQQLRCAQQWVARLPRATGQPGPLVRAARPAVVNPASNLTLKPKLTIGYLSSDFHAHATAFLIAELLEKHDRSRFVVHGYSFGPDDRSPMRQRLIRGLDRFVDITNAPAAAAAERIAADEVDILVDLKGYTQGARTPILALRPAPIQVNFLGYPGTMGAPFMDYILVDDFLVPENQQQHFSERLVHLPGCYQVNDSRRAIDPRTPSRAECGLPEQGFVFCSFNNNYKITPEVFGAWMSLLKAVPHSVLWLWETNRFAPVNLRKHAQSHGVDAGRLVFAPRRPLAEHLARLRLADLFLDTFPVNAHTTASDALWAGCPVVTIAGNTFVSRVAGSLLRAIGLPELITSGLEEYAQLAFQLAQDDTRLADLRARLAANRATSPLFDGAVFARNLETAFLTMWQTHAAGGAPRAFRVEPAGVDRLDSVDS